MLQSPGPKTGRARPMQSAPGWLAGNIAEHDGPGASKARQRSSDSAPCWLPSIRLRCPPRQLWTELGPAANLPKLSSTRTGMVTTHGSSGRCPPVRPVAARVKGGLAAHASGHGGHRHGLGQFPGRQPPSEPGRSGTSGSGRHHWGPWQEVKAPGTHQRWQVHEAGGTPQNASR